MTNKEFQIAFRKELKQAKRLVFELTHYPISCRHWNLGKSYLRALYTFMKTYTFVSYNELEKLIRLNPNTLKFLNDCINEVPNMLQVLQDEGYLSVFEKYYTNKRLQNEKNMQKQ